jgi:hypothetical protein
MNELLDRLKAVAPHRWVAKTRLTKSAYAKGIVAGINGDSVNPYRTRHLPNFMGGDNDPRYAWDLGHMDGETIGRVAKGETPASMTGAMIDVMTAHHAAVSP